MDIILESLMLDGTNNFTVFCMQQVAFLTLKFTLDLHLKGKMKFKEGC